MSSSKRDRENKSTISRRTFLTSMGVGVSTGLVGCQQLPVKRALPFLLPPEEVTPGVSVYYASTCTACPAACGLMVTVRDGRPIKLEGHPDHPLSAGGLCALGQAHIRELYHSKRYADPLLDGAKVSWEAVDARVDAALSRVAGKEVAILSPPVTSPTARRLLQSFAQTHGGTLVEHDARPSAPAAALEAWGMVAGRALLPALAFDRADVVLSLGADFLGTGTEVVAHTSGYAGRRRAHASRGPLRHIQVEGALSLTGAAADERRAMSAHEQRTLALHILREVGGGGAEAAALSDLPNPGDKAWADGLVALLKANKGKSLVLSGSDDLGEQVAVALVNERLGNLGNTLDIDRPSLATRGLDKDILNLEAKLVAGKVGALFVMPGIDPVRQLPGGASWAKALKTLPLSVCLTDHPTETANSCQVVAAAHHGLEMWGDAMPRPGVLTMVQPTARPLLNSRHPLEAILRWSGKGHIDYLDHLKQHWNEHVLTGQGDVETAWNRAVSSGFAPKNSAKQVDLPKRVEPDIAGINAALLATRKRGRAKLEVSLLAEVGTGDGCHAHNAWLRELPDPLTRVAWVPVVRVAPGLASSLGVADGDVLAIQVGKASVSMATRIVPGMHPAVLGVPVGFAEANGYALSQAVNTGLRISGLSATASPTGMSETLPAYQTHHSTEGRPIVHQLASHDAHVEAPHHDPAHNLWKHQDKRSTRWEMVIDLDACTGCGACVMACQSENNIPVVGPDEVARHRDLHWLRIDRYFEGPGDDPDVLFSPMLCQQCAHAPCETVCPALATMHSSDGLNMQIYNRCVGTRYCANNCPYKMRRFNWFNYDLGGQRSQPLDRMVLNPDVVVRDRGVMEKCTFCVQRIQAARISASGSEEKVVAQPACQQSCPAKAIRFGNGADPKSDVSRARDGDRSFKVLAELGVLPSVTYLARVRSRDEDKG